MTRTLIILILFSSLGIASVAQQPRPNSYIQSQATSPSLPTVDQILDQYVQALGGKAALEKLTSRVIKGSIAWSGQDGIAATEQYFKAPSKYMSITTLSSMGTYREGFDGNSGWSLNPNGSQRDWPSHEVAAAKRNRDFHKEIRLKALYPSIALKGKEKIGSRETYVLELTPASGKPERMYFDAGTGLLLMQEYELEGPQAALAFEYYYEDYREVDGVKVAFTVRRIRPSTYTIKVSEVKHNIGIDDEKFNKPTGQ